MVESGRKAIELIENRSFNLVLCDLHMPDIDGTGATPDAHTPGINHWPSKVVVARCARHRRGEGRAQEGPHG